MGFDSLFIGVTGLQAYQQQLDVISNNIANVGTNGYKGQNVNFQDLLYQQIGAASAPTATNGGVNPEDIGDGVKIGSIDTDFTQGGLQTTGINTNLAINGNGFFVLANTDGSGAPTYTRDGDFDLNDQGFLTDPSTGKAVLGYQVQPNGTISQVAPPSPLQIPLGLKSTAVGTGFGTKSGPAGDSVYDVSFGGNLNMADYATAVSSGGATLPLTTITTTVYDSLGDAHQVLIQFSPAVTATPNGGGAYLGNGYTVTNVNGVAVTAATEWQYTVVSTDGTSNASGTPSTNDLGGGYVFFDQNGQFINTSGNSGAGTASGATLTTHTAGVGPATTTGDQMDVSQWGPPNGANNSTAVPDAGSVPGAAAIGLDFSDMTSLSSQATANTVSQNGYSSGLLSNITIEQDGTINGSFTNGQSTALGRLALATFANDDGLNRIGQNEFTASASSGIAQYGFANSGPLGSIDSGALEQSNVSIATQFTNMILAQQAFQANSKSITVSNQDLQTVVGLIPGG